MSDDDDRMEEDTEFYDEDAEGSEDPDHLHISSGDSEAESEPDETESERESGGENTTLTAQDETAEIEIEGDFNRLVKNIRLTDGSSNTAGVLSKDWDLNLKDQEAEFRDDLRAASGIGRKKRKGTRQTGPVLSQQVRALIGEGNQSYVDNNIPEAVRIMQEVIRIEPRAVSAWSVLAQCHEDAGEHQKALQLRIMAAHLRHDAEEWDRLAKQSRELGYYQQALYCYRKIYSLEPNNVNALWDRAALAKETGDLRIARNSLLAILKRVPHDLTVLDELRPILIELSDLATCASLFAAAFEHYTTLYPSGVGPSAQAAESEAQVSGGGFAQMELLVLADLYNTLGTHEQAVSVIRRGVRWLQGRAEQRFWDVCEDDREYDEEGIGIGREGDVQPGRYPLDINARHRLAVARIKMGEVDEGKIHARIVLSQEVLDYAPLFAEIADAYFDRDMHGEALPIYETLSEHVETSSLYILLQVAACHRLLGDFPEAARVYEHVIVIDQTHLDAKMKLAEVYEVMKETRKALALVYEVIDARKKRPKATDGEQAAAEQGPASTSLFEEKSRSGKTRVSKQDPHKLTHAQLREMEEKKEQEVMRGYRRLVELWPTLLGKADAPGDMGEDAREQEKADVEREWMIEAEKLVETFRETRNLFMASRAAGFRGMFPKYKSAQKRNETDEDRMASRLQLDLEHDSMARKSKGDDGGKAQNVDIFRGVSFDDWLRIFMQYAFLLTRNDQYDLAEEVLRHILLSNAYQSKTLQDTIRITIITCAIIKGRYPVVVEYARKLILAHQFNNEPLRILLASLSSGLRSTDSFIASTLQKHVFRELKLGDTAVKNKDSLKWNPLNKRYALTGIVSAKADEGEEQVEEDENGNEEAAGGEPSEIEKAVVALPDMPTKDNPVIVAIYGQMCVAAKSYQSAIFYLLHAFDYCPDDPVICLSLAIASIGRAMQRQSDNRHHLIAQAMAFLSRYRALRASDPRGLDEVEFNFGRAFQQLGLHSHAVKHYERVLELAENKPKDELGLAREAAYNLSLIFVLTGATPLAQSLYRRWLSV